MVIQWWIWVVFAIAIVVMLLIDLFAFQREAHEVSRREAAISSTVCMAISKRRRSVSSSRAELRSWIHPCTAISWRPDCWIISA